MHTKLLSYLLMFSFIYGCGSKDTRETSGNESSSNTTSTISYARKLSIETGEQYYIIKVISPFTDATDTLHYALVKENCQKTFPSHYKVIDIPIKSAAILSSSHASLFLPFEREDVITAVSQANYFYAEKIHNRFDEGKITEVGIGSNINYEQIMANAPEVLMISGNSVNEMEKMEMLESSGITIVPNAEWRENHPLGRAEWIKLGGALLDEMATANEIFSKVERSYLGLRQKAMEATSHPQILVNAPFKGSWWMPSGNSYVARLLFDAGATYPWSDVQQQKALQLDMEAVMNTALNADCWINPGTARSLEALMAKDPRLNNFQAYKDGQVYNHTMLINVQGGNDYFERGVIRPDLILADLIKIFHPDLLEDHEFTFYQKLK